MTRKKLLKSLLVGISAWFAASLFARAADPAPPTVVSRGDSRRDDLLRQVHELDSPDYKARERAAAKIEHWVDSPEMASILAEQFRQLAVQPDLPLETRWRIETWLERLPMATDEPPPVARRELERLVARLDDNSYSIRAGATERLKWLAGSPRTDAALMPILRARIADPSITADYRERVDSICDIAWGAWVWADGPTWSEPPASDEQIAKWLDELRAASAEDQRDSAVRRRAREKLLDALCQDSALPRAKAAIEARLRDAKDSTAAARLNELLYLTRPTVVAESWFNGNQTLEQHLVIGVPMVNAAPANPSFFDRADDHVAHCASGNALRPGDYPVGVAFVPPNCNPEQPVIFRLVYLPTPRRQIAYSHYVKTDPRIRLIHLSRRTLDGYLSAKRLLDGAELATLGQLDAREVSRFAGRFFTSMRDGPVEEEFDQDSTTFRNTIGGQNSCFGGICAQLARYGTHEAVPGLLAAIRQKKFRRPTPAEPYYLSWVAALSIARRDPWPDADAWLAGNLDNSQSLMLGHDEWGHRLQRTVRNDGGPNSPAGESEQSATIGATAAAILLTRHGKRPEDFGLQSAADKQLEAMTLSGYCYGKPVDIEGIRQWWNRQAAAGTTTAAGEAGGN